MGKLVWSQYFTPDGETEPTVREVTSIDFGQIFLMAESKGWSDHMFHNELVGGAFSVDENFYHAHIVLKWTGEQPLYNCKFNIVASQNYTGSSDANTDLKEIQDWAGNGQYGINRFPTSCQIYNPCQIVVDEAYANGFYVRSWDDEHGGWATCVNLAELSHNKCLPCIDEGTVFGEPGNLVNLNRTANWAWLDETDRRAMYTYPGGLIIYQCPENETEIPDEPTWQQFNNNTITNQDSPAYTIPMITPELQPNSERHIYLRMCIPWGCFCGGKRAIGFGLDYIYTK